MLNVIKKIASQKSEKNLVFLDFFGFKFTELYSSLFETVGIYLSQNVCPIQNFTKLHLHLEDDLLEKNMNYSPHAS